MDEASTPVKAVIDARGLDCPLPLVRLRQALMVVADGALVRLLATDPQAHDDVTHFCLATDNELLETQREGTLLSFVVRKRG